MSKDRIEEFVNAAWKEHYKDVVEPFVEKNIMEAAQKLVEEAVRNRESVVGKHNFTGNLLESIVACVYKDGQPMWAFYASDEVRNAVYVKMTKGKDRHFLVDYEGDESDFKPNIETDQGLGRKDAIRFFETYKPDTKAAYHIVLAYPVEYATYVEQARGTVGFAMTYSYAKKNGRELLQLPIDRGRVYGGRRTSSSDSVAGGDLLPF